VDPALDRPLLVPFAPDTDDPANMIDATCGRYGVEMPEPKPDVATDFLSFAKDFIRALWPETLRDEDIQTFDEWLVDSNYPGGRKRQLGNLMRHLERMDSSFVKVKAFVKQEVYYPEPKRARAINSPSDESKCILGRIFKAVDKKTFSARFFVKGTNPREWPQKLMNSLGELPVTETDFTAFESHHRGVFTKVVYYWYLHMIRNLTNVRPIKDLVARLMLGRNIIQFKHINVQIDERLMSGALWTSSANGVLNLIIMAYLASGTRGFEDPLARVRWAVQDFQGFVEGDDGLCRDYGIRQSQIDDLGLVLKMEPHKNFTEANFCGIVCDSNEMKVIKDPLPALAKIFLLPPKYQDASDTRLKGLLRARALSYLCNFSHTPVLASACHWILRRTSGFCVSSSLAVLGEYHADWALIAERELKEARWKHSEIGDSTREIAYQRFGIPIHEQLRIEREFDACNVDRCPIDLSEYCPDIVFSHGERFLYYKGDEPQMRTQRLDPVVADILRNGLKPKKEDLSTSCATANRVFESRVHPLEYCVDTANFEVF